MATTGAMGMIPSGRAEAKLAKCADRHETETKAQIKEIEMERTESRHKFLEFSLLDGTNQGNSHALKGGLLLHTAFP